jgi:hypothetical protein
MWKCAGCGPAGELEFYYPGGRSSRCGFLHDMFLDESTSMENQPISTNSLRLMRRRIRESDFFLSALHVLGC